MDSSEKFTETQLPNVEKFYSSLNDENFNKEEFKNAQEIWDNFKIKNLQEFANLYNKVDILLLADVMKNFRNISLENI